MLNIYQYLAIPLGYLLGSIPSAFILGKLLGKFDLRSEGDGKVSAAAIHRRLGFIPFILAVSSDVGKALLAIFLANIISGNDCAVRLLTGVAVVAGHNWPVFLKFKGGLGATVIYGVLAAIAFVQLLIAYIPGLIYMIITKKSGASTGIIGVTLTIEYCIQKLYLGPQMHFLDIPWVLVPYPLVLMVFMVIKRYQIKKNMDHFFDFGDD